MQCAVIVRLKKSPTSGGDACKKKYVINSGIAQNELYSGIAPNELYAEIKPFPNATNMDKLHNNSYHEVLSGHTPATDNIKIRV